MKPLKNLSWKNLHYKQVTAFVTVFLILFLGIAFNYAIELKVLHSVQLHTSKNDSIIQHEKYQQLVEKTMFLITQSEHNLEDYIQTADVSKLNDYKRNISAIENNLQQVKTAYAGYIPKYLVNIFIHKANNNIGLNKDIFDAYEASGQKAALALINSTESRTTLKELSFSVQELVNALNSKIAYLNNEISKEKTTMLALDKKWNVVSLVFMSLIALFVLYKMNETNRLNSSLSVAVKREQQSQLAKDKFISNVTHELRTPLNSIIGYTNLLLKKKHSEETKQWIHAMKISGNLLMEVINDVLDYSKLESGHVQFNRQPFNLQEVLANLSKVMQVRAESKNLEFVVEMDEEMPLQYTGDEKKLMQVLVNLIGNSIKFTENGFIRIHTSLLKKNEHHSWIQFVITDTGVGIEKSKLPYIFERFYQVESVHTKKYIGTGLGLPIVKQLVEMQGGHIDVTSAYGKGSQFTVIIPYTEARREETNPGSGREKMKVVRRSDKQKKILIVDDNEMNRDLMGFILTQGNFAYEKAFDGMMALNMLAENEYDFILMDVQMPGISGIETTRKIRSELHLQTPIIGLSGYSMPQEQQMSIHAGMNAYLTKPVDEVKLFELLDYYADFRTQEPVNIQWKLINISYLNRVTAGNKEYIEHVVEKAFDLLPVEMKKLQEWFEDDDEEKMKEIAHSMKTTLHVLGVKEVVCDKIRLLEKADFSKRSEKEKVTILLQELDDSVKVVLQELKEYLAAA